MHKRERDVRPPSDRGQGRTRLVIIIMVVLIALVCMLFIHSLRTQLYEQRAYSLEQTTEKIVQIMNTVINNEWDRLNYVSHALRDLPPATSAQLLERLAGYHAIDPLMYTWKLSCIDSRGVLYTWDGEIGRWPSPELLLSSRPNHQITLREERGSSGAEQMVFLYRLDEPIVLTGEDITLTHTLLTLDMASFGEALEVSAFDGNSYSYITEPNGSRLYHQQNQTEFIAAYNILTALEKFDFFYGGSYQTLAAAAAEGTPSVAEFDRGGKRYFVSYAPLSVNDWSLYLFVPEANVGGNTAHFVRLLLVQVCAVAGLLILVIGLFVRGNARQTLAQQQLAVDEARRANRTKSDFLSHMSHDMRTPLNGIMGMCHIAAQRIDDPAAMIDSLEKIDIASRQLLALINDVLDMSRIEQHKVEVNPAPVDLYVLLRGCTIHIEVTVSEHGIEFVQDTDGLAHPCVSADPILLEKILTNLLGNAAKFTLPGGRITLRASEHTREPGMGIYRFEVADTGIGMHPEFLEHLFEPFSQEHSGSRTQYQGTGLGLSIVKSLVDALGGTIEVQSEPGKGSSFAVTLPLAYADEADLICEAEPSAAFDGRGMRALLVEDNELNRMIAQTILEECGFAVDTAADGAIAVAAFGQSPPWYYDLIVMDVRMPVMDGLEASRTIRALPRDDAAAVPIIALTADALTGDIERTHEAGMNDHLRKPIELDRLYAVLQEHCTRGRRGR